MNTLFSRDLEQLSRREFLRWLQRGLGGLLTAFLIESAQGSASAAAAAPAGDFSENEPPPEKGRVLNNSLAVYEKPSFSSKLVNMYWRDLVLPINAVTIGDKEPAHNRVWYRVNDEGYCHSGQVQPVALRYNEPVASLPEKGRLGEISVPFSDAVRNPDRPERVANRLYFSSVHWVMAVKKDKQGKTWYKIPDDKRKFEYYVNAEHVRLIEPADIAPISASVPAKDKRLEVQLHEQVLVAYEDDLPVFMTRIASGGHFSDGDYRTPPGEYITNRKRPSRHMASEDLAAPSSYDLPGVPWVCYLTQSGISFHGTYWHNDFGKPRSHGCINLSSHAALWVYRWTQPAVPYGEQTWKHKEGTAVSVKLQK